MQKDINRKLLVLIVIILVLFISTTIYFETAMSKALSRYKKEQDIFGGLSANAVLEELNSSSNLKENVLKYKEYLDKKYDELSTVNKDLKKQIENLQAELRLVKSQIDYQKAKEIGPTEQFRLFQSKNEEIQKLKDKIKELCNDFKSYNITNPNCVQANWE